MRKYPLSLLKDKNIVTFFDFWGKTRRGEKDGGDDYHLLCWHSLDVRGIEGSRVRQTYALLAKQYGVKWNGRKYDPKDWEKGDVVNRCISAATSCL